MRTFVRLSAISLLALNLAPQRSADAGKIEAARREINEPESASDDDKSPGGRAAGGRRGLDEGNSLSNGPFGLVMLCTVACPWWGPIVALKDDYSITASFPPAPFADGYPGYLVPDDEAPYQTRNWAGRLTLNAGSDFSDLALAGGRLQVENASRFGFDASGTLRSENLHPGSDELWIGDANFTYRFAQNGHAQFYTGLGLNWANDHGDGDLGFNFTYGADWFPARPLGALRGDRPGNTGQSHAVSYSRDGGGVDRSM